MSSGPSSLVEALLRQARTRPDKIAFEDGGDSLTYAELAGRVGAMAETCADLPRTIGLLGPSGLDWVVAALGISASGRTVVPLPDFFSDSQLAHIVGDANLSVIVTAGECAARTRALGCRPLAVATGQAPLRTVGVAAGRHIIYTSGSTGRPKGVVLENGQISTTCAALLQVVPIGQDETHLSVLPYSLLLEMICGIYLPILAGGKVHIAAEILQAYYPGARVGTWPGDRPGPS